MAVELLGGLGKDLQGAHNDCEEGEQPPPYLGFSLATLGLLNLQLQSNKHYFRNQWLVYPMPDYHSCNNLTRVGTLNYFA